MLSAAHRLRARSDFREVVRRGRRAGRPTLTVHLTAPAGLSADDVPVQAGLVVSRAVGGSVVRSRVSRRLRHLLRDRVDTLAPGTRLVVRASAAAATSSSAALGVDLDAALASLARPRSPAGTPTRTRS